METTTNTTSTATATAMVQPRRTDHRCRINPIPSSSSSSSSCSSSSSSINVNHSTTLLPLPPSREQHATIIKTIEANASLMTLPTTISSTHHHHRHRASSIINKRSSAKDDNATAAAAAARERITTDSSDRITHDNEKEDDNVIMQTAFDNAIGNIISNGDDDDDDGAEDDDDEDAGDDDDCTTSSSSSEDGDSFNNSISLTDLHPLHTTNSGGRSDCYTTNDNNNNNNTHNSNINSNSNSNSNNPLPAPPRHFLCPIQNTLLQDPVIDREGHTYERDAILRWLVLTSQTFEGGGRGIGSEDAMLNNGVIIDDDDEITAPLEGDDATMMLEVRAVGGGTGAATPAPDGAVGIMTATTKNSIAGGDAHRGAATATASSTSTSAFGRGTSPITGNPMSVEELVEDVVVKGAIERWRKECWVRFLLGNKKGLGCNNGEGSSDEKVQFLMENDVSVDEAGEGDADADDVSNRSCSGKERGVTSSDKRRGRGGGRTTRPSAIIENREKGSCSKEGTRSKKAVQGTLHDLHKLDKPQKQQHQHQHQTQTQGNLHDLHKLHGKAAKKDKSRRNIIINEDHDVGGLDDGLDKLKRKPARGKRHGAIVNDSHTSNKSNASNKSRSEIEGGLENGNSTKKKKKKEASSNSAYSNKSTKSNKSSLTHKSEVSHKSHASNVSGGGKHEEHKSQKHHPSTSSSKHKEYKSKSPRHCRQQEAHPETAPNSNAISSSMATNKQYPPPPPKGGGSTTTATKQVGRSMTKQGGSKRRDRQGKSISTSQRTAITSNTTPTAKKPHHPISSRSSNSIPPPPFSPASSTVHAASSPTTSYQEEEDCEDDSTVPPIKQIIQKSATSNTSNSSSFCSNLSNPYDFSSLPQTSLAATTQPRQQFNGWSVPLGVHKVVCASPGLRVASQVHRRSVAVKVPTGTTTAGTAVKGNDNTTIMMQSKELMIPPGAYVEILETQVHGERVRGRICWEEECCYVPPAIEKSKKKGIKKRTSRLLKRTSRKKLQKSVELERRIVRYEGWISLQWAKNEEEDDDADGRNEDYDVDKKDDGGINRGSGSEGRVTDEDSGPWTEPVPLGVYRINFGGGLPLRETPERDSPVLGKLDRGRCVEVVQTQVKGDRVRARVIVPNVQPKPLLDKKIEEDKGEQPLPGNNNSKGVRKFTSGWISLLNALTGSSGASPVPLGAYVVVAEPGCVITEGGRLDSKIKGTLVPGSCMEVVATRMEEGVVRGLIDGGGHVTLFVPPGMSRERLPGNSNATTSSSGGSSNNGGSTRKKNALDGGRMFAMPVPLGTYQITQNALMVTAGISPTSSIVMKLQLHATVEIIETRVEDGCVRGRICSVINEDGTRVVGYEKAGSSAGSLGEVNGWINLFEPNMRWAKIVCFKGGRPVNGGGGGQVRRESSAHAPPSC